MAGLGIVLLCTSCIHILFFAPTAKGYGGSGISKNPPSASNQAQQIAGGNAIRAGEDMNKTRDRLKAIIDQMPVGLIVLDEHGDISMANPASERIFGSDINEKTMRDLLPPDMSNITKSGTYKTINGQNVFKMEGVRADGTEFAVEIAAKDLLSLGGENKRVVAIARDITEHEKLERAKAEFVAMVSHELRTPLTSVRAYLDMLAQGVYGNVSDDAKRKAEGANRNVARLISLVNDILDFEKIEAGKYNYNFKEVSLAQVLDESIEAVQALAFDMNIRIERDEVNSNVRADHDSAVQVVINLLSNAVKFSANGDTIAVGTKSDGKFVEVTITDNGPGIPEEMFETVFQRFGQAGPAKSERIKGTGLGLAICKKIIEQHGGTIGVRSRVGSGSTFWFTLPIAVS